MDVFNLKAKINLDSSEYEQGLSRARSSTTSFLDIFKGNLLSSAVTKAFSGITNAVGKGIGAVKNFVSESVSAFGEFEQLAGGVETLFGNASRSAADYADDIASKVATANEKLGEYAARYGEDYFDAWADDLYEKKLAQVGKMTEKQKNEFFDELEKEYESYVDYVGMSEEQVTAKAEKEYKDRAAAQELVMNNAKNAWKTAGLSMNQYMETVTGFSASLAQSLNNDQLKTAEYADRALSDMSDNANKMGSNMGSIMNAYMGFSKQNYTMLDNLKLGYGGTKTEMERLIKDASKMTKVQQELNLVVDEGDMSFGNIVNAISVVQKQLDITGTTSKEAATTIQGSLSATKAAWENVKIAFSTGEGLEEAFDNLMEAIFGDGQTTGLVNQVLPRIAKVFESIGKYLPTIMSKLADQLPALLDALKPIFDSIKNAVVAIFTSDEFRDALSRIGSFIMETLKAGLDTVGLGGIVDAIQWLWDNRSTITTIGEVLLAAFAGKKLIDGISSVAGGIKNIVGGIGGAGAAGTGAAGAGAAGGVGSGLLAAAPIMIVIEGAREIGSYAIESQKIIDDIKEHGGAVVEAYKNGSIEIGEATEQLKEKTNDSIHGVVDGWLNAPLVASNPLMQLFGRAAMEQVRDEAIEGMQGILDAVSAGASKTAEVAENNSDRLFKAVNNSLPIPSDVANKWEELGTIAQDGSAYIADATKSNLAGIPSDVADMQAGISSTIQYGVDDVVSSLDRLRAAANDNQQQIADVADATKSTLAGVPSTVLDAMTGASTAVNYGVDDMVSSLERLRKAASRAASSIWDVADASASSLAGVPSDVLDKMAARHYATAVDNPVIFDKPEYAMVGDGTEPEILMGISTFKAMLEQAQNTIQAQVNVSPTGARETDRVEDRQIIIPVYIGDEQIDEIVVDALRRQQYLTGGR